MTQSLRKTPTYGTDSLGQQLHWMNQELLQCRPSIVSEETYEQFVSLRQLVNKDIEKHIARCEETAERLREVVRSTPSNIAHTVANEIQNGEIYND